MRLGRVLQNRIDLDFEYWRVGGGEEVLVARGAQQVACMRRDGRGVVAEALPEPLLKALEEYR
jgi:enediyne biosynthesis thioesterase